MAPKDKTKSTAKVQEDVRARTSVSEEQKQEESSLSQAKKLQAKHKKQKKQESPAREERKSRSPSRSRSPVRFTEESEIFTSSQPVRTTDILSTVDKTYAAPLMEGFINKAVEQLGNSMLAMMKKFQTQVDSLESKVESKIDNKLASFESGISSTLQAILDNQDELKNRLRKVEKSEKKEKDIEFEDKVPKKKKIEKIESPKDSSSSYLSKPLTTTAKPFSKKFPIPLPDDDESSSSSESEEEEKEREEKIQPIEKLPKRVYDEEFLSYSITDLADMLEKEVKSCPDNDVNALNHYCFELFKKVYGNNVLEDLRKREGENFDKKWFTTDVEGNPYYCRPDSNTYRSVNKKGKVQYLAWTTTRMTQLKIAFNCALARKYASNSSIRRWNQDPKQKLRFFFMLIASDVDRMKSFNKKASYMTEKTVKPISRSQYIDYSLTIEKLQQSLQVDSTDGNFQFFPSALLDSRISERFPAWKTYKNVLMTGLVTRTYFKLNKKFKNVDVNWKFSIFNNINPTYLETVKGKFDKLVKNNKSVQAKLKKYTNKTDLSSIDNFIDVIKALLERNRFVENFLLTSLKALAEMRLLFPLASSCDVEDRSIYVLKWKFDNVKDRDEAKKSDDSDNDTISGQFRTVIIVKASDLFNIPLLALKLLIRYFNIILHVKEEVYSSDEWVSMSDNLQLDSFCIEAIDIGRADAGGRDNEAIFKLLKLRGEANTNHNNRPETDKLDWCTIHHYYSTGNTCFIKILREQAKAKGRIRESTYVRGLWKQLDQEFKLDTYQKPLDYKYASMFAAKYNFYLIVHDIDGNVIEPKNNNRPEGFDVLRVLLHQNHYMLVDDYNRTKIIDFGKVSDLPKEDKSESIEILVFYDFETVNLKTNYDFSETTPYSISWFYGIYDDIGKWTEESVKEQCYVDSTDTPSVSIIEKWITTILAGITKDACESKIQGKQQKKYNIRFIAFNGSSFDHILIMKYFFYANYKIIRPPSTDGKVYSFHFRINQDLGQVMYEGEMIKLEKFEVNFECWDPRLYLQGSLSSLGKSFKLKVEKEVFSHKAAQDAYDSGNFKTWLSSNKEKLESYNKNDVVLLTMITAKYYKVMKDLKDINIFNYTTIASCSWKVFSNYYISASLNGEKVKDKLINLCLPVQTPEIDDIVRSSMIAGRVHGLYTWTRPTEFKLFVDKKQEKMVAVDVTSLYPFVMYSPEKVWDKITVTKSFANKGYPIGKEELILVGDAVDCYNDANKVGLYYVRVITPEEKKRNGLAPILPIKIEKDGARNLCWRVKPNEWWGFLPDITLKLLEEQEYDFDFMACDELLDKDNNPCCAIVWNSSTKVFSAYIEEMKAEKQKQDDMKKVGNPNYNPALREALKLFLNNLSGKPAQRVRWSSSEICKNNDDLVKFAKMHEDIIDFYFPTENTCIVEYANLKINWKKSAKPSQLSCFIYAYARAYMTQAVFLNTDVYYTDTDSAFIPKSYADSLSFKQYCYPDFGGFQVEEDAPNGFDKLVYIAKKWYAYYVLEGQRYKMVKCKVKGVNKNSSFYFNKEEYFKFGTHIKSRRLPETGWIPLFPKEDDYLHAEIMFEIALNIDNYFSKSDPSNSNFGLEFIADQFKKELKSASINYRISTKIFTKEMLIDSEIVSDKDKDIYHMPFLKTDKLSGVKTTKRDEIENALVYFDTDAMDGTPETYGISQID